MKDLVLGPHHELVLVEGPQALVALGPEQPESRREYCGNNLDYNLFWDKDSQPCNMFRVTI